MDGSHPFLPLLLSASLCQATSLHWLGGRPQALGLTVAVGGHQLGLSIGKLWAGGLEQGQC